jgi:hypothetical protein
MAAGARGTSALMVLCVTTQTECDQVVHHIIAKLAPGFYVVDV